MFFLQTIDSNIFKIKPFISAYMLYVHCTYTFMLQESAVYNIMQKVYHTKIINKL